MMLALLPLSARKLLTKDYRRDEPEEGELPHLKTAIEGAYRGLEPFRTLNQSLVESYAGPAYGSPRDKRKRYIYKMHQMVKAYTMLLAANRPQVDVNTPHLLLHTFAKHFEVAVNNLLKEIGLEHTLRRWVLDAFFTVGVVKVFRREAVPVQVEANLWMDPGCPFAGNVSLDNFVYDMTARSWAEVKWAGDMYRIPKADVDEGVRRGLYDPKVAKECLATSKYYQPPDRLAAISAGEAVDGDEYEPMVDLCDVWVKRDNAVYTFIVKNCAKFSIHPRPLAVMQWEDPDQSPYHILGFNEVPENVMPIGPAVIIDELDRLANNIMRKQSRGAMNQKNVVVYRPGPGADTAKQIQRANDGGLVAGDPTSIHSLRFNGADGANQMFLDAVMRTIDEMAGNLPALLGLGAQAETASQEELIHASANRIVGQMQVQVVDAVRRLVRSLGLLLWNDELKEIAGEMQVEGADIRVPVVWRPGDREGNFLDYNFDINVNSLPLQQPAARAEKLLQLMTQLYIPLEQQLAMQGGTINFARLNEVLAEDLGQPVLRELVSFNSAPTVEPQRPGPSASTKPAVTQRSYTRTSRPSGEADRMRQQQLLQQMIAQQNEPVAQGAL